MAVKKASKKTGAAKKKSATKKTAVKKSTAKKTSVKKTGVKKTAAVKKTARKGAAKAHKVGETMTAVGQAVQAAADMVGSLIDGKKRSKKTTSETA
jgi:hypothetical protein